MIPVERIGFTSVICGGVRPCAAPPGLRRSRRSLPFAPGGEPAPLATRSSARRRHTARHIELRIRADSDLEVAFIVPSKPGSPFEQVFSGPTPEAGMVRREALAFVSDLVAERIVLAWDAQRLGGGRRFLKASDLNPETLRHVAWVACNDEADGGSCDPAPPRLKRRRWLVLRTALLAGPDTACIRPERRGQSPDGGWTPRPLPWTGVGS